VPSVPSRVQRAWRDGTPQGATEVPLEAPRLIGLPRPAKAGRQRSQFAFSQAETVLSVTPGSDACRIGSLRCGLAGQRPRAGPQRGARESTATGTLTAHLPMPPAKERRRLGRATDLTGLTLTSESPTGGDG
jgi:hypothetical protein